MTDEAAFLAALPGFAFAFMLVLARVAAAVMLLPGIGEAELPASLRAGLAALIAALLVPSLAPLMPPPPVEAWRGAAMIAAETVTGLWLGWLARLLVLALPIAGSLIAYLLGLSNVLQLDPALSSEVPALGRLLGLAGPLLLFISGLYVLPLQALAGSWRLIPPGALLPAGDATETVLRAVTGAFALAVRLAAPFVLASLVWQVALGMLSRLVPRLQVYFVAMPGQILGGLLLFATIATSLLAVWARAAESGFLRLPGAG